MNSKMLPSLRTVLLLPALLLLAACAGWSGDGLRIQELPKNVTEPCPHPMDVIKTVSGTSVGSDEIRMGRLGDALIECGQEKEIAVEGYQQLSKILK